MKRPKTVTAVVTVGVMLAAGVVFGLFVIFSGVYNVSADKPHTRLMYWVLSETSDHSVGRHAEGVKVPADFNRLPLAVGQHHYLEMCVMCHGGPGVQRSEIGRGLNPEPPLLYKSVVDMSPAEVYWVVRHGIKMTGMPSFGVTHTESQLWAITAFVKHLPKVTPAQFKQMLRERGDHEQDEGHAPASQPAQP